jgi:sec-independent protein translocase protein TatC
MTTVLDSSGQSPASMPLTAHLAELRNRLIWSIAAILVGGVVGFYFGDELVAYLEAQLPAGANLQQIELGDGFTIQIQIALVVGVALAMPVLLWHIWRFVAPGLTRSEQRAILPWIPMALIFFIIGVAIALVILPFASQFLLQFVPSGVQKNINIRSYFDFATSLFLVFGLMMEFPILLVGLSRVGIITSARLVGVRRLVIVGTLIFSTIITPGGDLVSPTVLWLTLLILFEFTIFFIRRTGR